MSPSNEKLNISELCLSLDAFNLEFRAGGYEEITSENQGGLIKTLGGIVSESSDPERN